MNPPTFTPNPRLRAMAEEAADDLLTKLNITREEVPDTLVVTGTGWGDVIGTYMDVSVSRDHVAGFDPINNAPGHAGIFGIAQLGSCKVAATSGRVHMWQASAYENPRRVEEMVRLQHEMWAVLGIKNIIVTCGAGSLDDSLAPKGTVVVLSDVDHGDISLPFGTFVTPGAPINPLQLGRCTRPAVQALHELGIGWVHVGPYKMMRGPTVESLQRKLALASQGFVCVGMSIVPALAVAHLYGINAIALALITNGMVEVLDGAQNAAAGRNEANRLYYYIRRLVSLLQDRTVCL